MDKFLYARGTVTRTSLGATALCGEQPEFEYLQRKFYSFLKRIQTAPELRLAYAIGTRINSIAFWARICYEA